MKSELANPTRELFQKACEEIADEIGRYFVKEIKFAVKGPNGDEDFDADDVTIKVDGKTIDVDSPVRVIVSEHEIVAYIDGYKKIQRIIEITEDDAESKEPKVIKLNFKKIQTVQIIPYCANDFMTQNKIIHHFFSS